MKGLIVKSKDKTCKAGIPQCGVGIVANITWHSGLTWTLSGLKMLYSDLLDMSDVRYIYDTVKAMDMDLMYNFSYKFHIFL